MATAPFYEIQDDLGSYFIVDLDFPFAHIYDSIEFCDEEKDEEDKIEYAHLFSISYERSFLGWEEMLAPGSSVLLKLDVVVPSEIIRKTAGIQKLQKELHWLHIGRYARIERNKRRTPKQIRKVSQENKKLKIKIQKQMEDWELEDKKQKQKPQYTYLFLARTITLFNTDTPVTEFVGENNHGVSTEFSVRNGGPYAVTEDSCYFVLYSARISKKTLQDHPNPNSLWPNCSDSITQNKNFQRYPFLEICSPFDRVMATW
jgi:hypothetical protein